MSAVGLRLSEEKTLITHIDEGLDFLGWRIQRHRKRGTTRQYVYNYPARKALRAVTVRCKAICRMNVSLPLAVLLHQLNPVLRGWTAYFRPGVSSRALQPGPPAPAHDRLAPGTGMAPAQAPQRRLEGTAPPLLRRPVVATRWRGAAVQSWCGNHHAVPPQGNDDSLAMAQHDLRTGPARRGLWRAGCGANPHVRFGRAAWRNRPGAIPALRSRPTPP